MLKSLGARIALIHVCYMVLLSAVVLTTGTFLQAIMHTGESIRTVVTF